MTDTSKTPLLQVKDLVKSYDTEEGFLGKLVGGNKRIPALNGVALELYEGEFLGLTGESGSGKSALGKIIAGLEKADSGTVTFMGQNLSTGNEAEVKKARRYMRFISEENFSGLTNDPKNRLDNMLYNLVDRFPGEGGKSGGRAYADELLQRVGLGSEYLDRFPNQLSGGERQRFAIARALATRPKLVVADEPVSNLDLNTRTEVLQLMRSLGRQFGTAFLFISHNLSMVRYFAVPGRTAIMFGGRIVEVMPTELLFDLPAHPYTRTLLEVNPAPTPLPGAALDPRIALHEAETLGEDKVRLATLDSTASDLSIEGNVSAAAQLAAANRPGCAFYRWCPEHLDLCQKETPRLSTVVRKPGLVGEGVIERVPLTEEQIDERHAAACVHYGKDYIQQADAELAKQ